MFYKHTLLVFKCLLIFSEKIRLDISCESSARQMIHMKYQALFSLKNIKQIKMLSPEVVISTLRVNQIVNEPAHDKTYNKTCVTSKDSDQPVHPHIMARVLVYSSLNSLEADLSLGWSHKSYWRFYSALAHMLFSETV